MQIRNYYLANCIDWIYKKTSFLNSFDVTYYSGLDGLFMEIERKLNNGTRRS